ncbi:LPS export ABC transporter periplasmic protein LptC [Fontimonas sp. SYSU GA230001]|uniref:LPS export ABC transporter periplasmic protein LptC n=1 Tax=Fontimonas sp. SYSU GA230001 TaxID=3142450 RepID=UPI0032B32793
MGLDRHALSLPALGVLALLAGWLAFQAFREPSVPETIETAERPRYHLDGARWWRYGDGGEPVFEAQAAGIDYYDDASMELTEIRLSTHGAARRGSWQLSAARGSVPPAQKRIELKPEVRIDGQPQDQPSISIVTPTLWADWGTQLLTTDDPVVAQSPGRRLSAIGLRADWAGERVQFLSQVESRYVPIR